MKTSFKSFAPVFIISIVLLMIIMFLPLFSVWGGTLNFEYGSSDETFFDVMSFVFGGNNWMSYDMWVVQFTLAAIIPTILLLIFALCKVKGMCVFSSIAGAAGMSFMFIRYCSDSDYNMEHLVGKYSSISIGAWLVLALFIIAIILSTAIKTKRKEPAIAVPAAPVGNNNANSVITTTTSKGCGSSSNCQYMDLGKAKEAGSPENVCFCTKQNLFVERHDNCEYFLSYGCNNGFCEYADHDHQNNMCRCSYLNNTVVPKDTCPFFKNAFENEEMREFISRVSQGK